MNQLCDIALQAALSAGASYVEARVVQRTREMLQTKNGQLEMSTTLSDAGIGIRALVNNGWGYGATNILSPEGVALAGQRAVATAAATANSKLAPIEIPEASSGSYETPLEEDPFKVSMDEKTAIFQQSHETMQRAANLKATRGLFLAHRQETTFRASNGSRQHQTTTLCGGGVNAIAVQNGEVQIRSFPKGFEGNFLQGGFEEVRQMGLVSNAERIADEALALTRAEPAPTGPTTIVLDGAQLSLQIHESVGHPLELDRVLGEEISLAGASFVLPDKLDRFQYASERVNLTADATTPKGPGTFAFDDEGTPATTTPVVKNGRFVGYLSGRDAAARLGRPSASALRAETWSRIPIVRMVNVNLEPGHGNLTEMIGGIDEGLLLSTNKSWSIDDLRLNFQFSTEIAYEIKAGQLTGRIFKNPVYTGVTPQFWRSCSGICGPDEWRMWGWSFCGKGDPGQIMYVGHGCAPSRFDNITVSSA
jgi:TldD protein